MGAFLHSVLLQMALDASQPSCRPSALQLATLAEFLAGQAGDFFPMTSRSIAEPNGDWPMEAIGLSLMGLRSAVHFSAAIAVTSKCRMKGRRRCSGATCCVERSSSVHVISSREIGPSRGSSIELLWLTILCRASTLGWGHLFKHTSRFH